jgi:imidazolonepropionase-like amidohydrolase
VLPQSPLKLLTGLCLLLLLPGGSYAQHHASELAIQNVRVFDSKTKRVRAHKTVLIDAGLIVGIVSANQNVHATTVLEGNDRLVVPGFIDTHTHLRNVYGSLEEVAKNQAGLDRQKLADTYLRYGTTTIVDMGQPEQWIDTSLAWQQHPLPDYPNLFITGGAMVSAEAGRQTYMNHVAVANPAAARQKVQDYAERGIEYVKIYWRLRKPDLEAVVAEGQKQHLTISAHIDNNVTTMTDALALGVQNFEHVLTLPPAVLVLNEHRAALRARYGLGDAENVDKFLAQILFYFDYIQQNPVWDAQLNALLAQLAHRKATLSTAIHILGSVAGKTYFPTSLTLHADSINLAGYTPTQRTQLRHAFDVMMHYVKLAQEKGVRLRIGTDCPDGGKALLSELLLLHEAGFSTEDVLQIATWNGAQAMRLSDRYGVLEKGKAADLILFDKNPLDDYRNLLSEKVIVKGGKVFRQ